MQINLETGRFAVTLRFFMVAVLTVALLIPLLLVFNVVDDRQGYYREAIGSIVAPWGGAVRVIGPIILIPLAEREPGSDRRQVLAAMPAELHLAVDAKHEMRRRGIFEAPMFLVEVTARGRFGALDEAELRRRFGALRLDQAAVTIGISDTRGVRSAALNWGEEAVPLAADASPLLPGLRGDLWAVAGPKLRLRGKLGSPGLAELSGSDFSLNLQLRGAERIAVVPVGDTTGVAFTSSWPHPSFDGRFLPDEHRLTDNGFRAAWTTVGLARGFPSVVALDAAGDGLFYDKDLGFSVFEPLNLYGAVARAIKYGVLFVALTMVGVLCLELASGRRFHAVQYGVAGIALVLFFLVLLALAEHVGFTAGYAVAATMLTLMIGAYAYGATRDGRLALIATGLLAGLYGVLYFLLQLEQYALLAGAGVLLAALGMLMWVTRRLTPAAAGEEPAPP